MYIFVTIVKYCTWRGALRRIWGIPQGGANLACVLALYMLYDR